MAALTKHSEGSGYYVLDFEDVLAAGVLLESSVEPTVRVVKQVGTVVTDYTTEFVDSSVTPAVQNTDQVLFKMKTADSGEQARGRYLVVGICDADDGTVAVGVAVLVVSERGRLT